MKVKFTKVGEKVKEGDFEITLVDNTEILVKSPKIEKLVNMRINVIGLTLEVDTRGEENVSVRCAM